MLMLKCGVEDHSPVQMVAGLVLLPNSFHRYVHFFFFFDFLCLFNFAFFFSTSSTMETPAKQHKPGTPDPDDLDHQVNHSRFDNVKIRLWQRQDNNKKTIAMSEQW